MAGGADNTQITPSCSPGAPYVDSPPRAFFPMIDREDKNPILLGTLFLSSSYSECDISSWDFSVSRLFSIFWEYRYLSQKFRSWKKKSVSVSKIFGLEKKSPIGLQNIWSQKKSRYRSRKDSVSKKSLSIGLKNFGLKKVSVTTSKNLVSKKSH